MTSKERFRVAMQRGTPDRVPVIAQICPPHAIRVAGLPFRETAVDWLRDPRKYDLFEADCARNYGLDGVRIWPGAPPKNIVWEGEDAYEVDPDTDERVGMVDFMGGCGVVPLAERRRRLTDEDIEAIEVVPWEQLIEGVLMAPARKVVEKYGDEMFMIGAPSGFGVDSNSHVQGVEPTLMDIVDRPDFLKRMTARRLEVVTQRSIAFVKVGVDVIYIGETFGQMMSPAQFADLSLPYFQQFMETMHAHGVLVYLHMCGGVEHLLDLMADTGADCIEPLDEVGGTRVAEAKRRVGHRAALMGGVKTTLLSRGSLQEVKDDCARCIREAGDGGGYILACCDMLPTETEPEKVRVMVEAVKTLGRYDG